MVAGHSGRAVWGVDLGRSDTDRGFESRSRHGCLSLSFCVMLSYVGRCLATSWSLVQESYQVCKYIKKTPKCEAAKFLQRLYSHGVSK
jgi:hypothetical protein